MSSDWVDFSAVKAAVSLAAVLKAYGIGGLRRSGPAGQLRGRCPLHGCGGEDAFQASLEKNAFHCFYCQAHGNVLDLVAALEGCSVRQAALRLQQQFGIAGRAGMASGRKKELVAGKEEYNPPLSFALTGVQNEHPYLAGRGVRPETARHFGVGFYAGPGIMSGRVVIPIQDGGGRTVAYCGRSTDTTAPKYKLPAGFRKALVLFNLHRAVASGEPTAVVVEGFFDCMQVHQAGVRSVVALMGTWLSGTQEQMLLKHFRRLLLMLDGDEAGQQATAALAARLSGKCPIMVVRLPANTQPDQLPAAEIRSVLATAEEWRATHNARALFRSAIV
jgi:DNA primase